MNFNLSQKAFNLIIKFEIISFIISLIGTLILYIHLTYFIDFVLYKIGIKIFRAGLFAGVFSFCFGLFFEKVKNIQ